MRFSTLSLLLFAVAVLPFGARAEVVITEIMYDAPGTDEGHEWIEVQNTGETSVDLSTYRLFENSSNHKIVAYDSTPTTLAAGAFAVIADNPGKFFGDFPAFVGNIFDSAFSLSNTGETLEIRDSELATLDTALYSGANGASGDGNTLHRSGDLWVAASASPGIEGGESPAEEGILLEENDSAAATSSKVVSSVSRSKIDAGKNRTVIVGVENSFSAILYDERGNRNEALPLLWTFGDGAAGNGHTATHAYFDPGEYVVMVRHESYALSTETSFTVTVVALPIIITSDTEAGIVIQNRDTRLADLSGWRIREGGVEFIIPEKTSILAKRSVSFNRRITNLPYAGEVVLLYPNGNTATVWPIVSKPTPVSSQSPKVTISSAPHAEMAAPRVLGAAIVPTPSTSSVATSTNSFIRSPWTWSFGGFIAIAGLFLVLL